MGSPCPSISELGPTSLRPLLLDYMGLSLISQRAEVKKNTAAKLGNDFG